jgi:hypothetical protein
MQNRVFGLLAIMLASAPSAALAQVQVTTTTTTQGPGPADAAKGIEAAARGLFGAVTVIPLVALYPAAKLVDPNAPTPAPLGIQAQNRPLDPNEPRPLHTDFEREDSPRR